MSDDELRELVSECDAMEKRLSAPYAKARRSWTVRRERAQAELEGRALNRELLAIEQAGAVCPFCEKRVDLETEDWTRVLDARYGLTGPYEDIPGWIKKKYYTHTQCQERHDLTRPTAEHS